LYRRTGGPAGFQEGGHPPGNVSTLKLIANETMKIIPVKILLESIELLEPA
jgi:hypothetical protein